LATEIIERNGMIYEVEFVDDGTGEMKMGAVNYISGSPIDTGPPVDASGPKVDWNEVAAIRSRTANPMKTIIGSEGGAQDANVGNPEYKTPWEKKWSNMSPLEKYYYQRDNSYLSNFARNINIVHGTDLNEDLGGAEAAMARPDVQDVLLLQLNQEINRVGGTQITPDFYDKTRLAEFTDSVQNVFPNIIFNPKREDAAQYSQSFLGAGADLMQSGAHKIDNVLFDFFDALHGRDDYFEEEFLGATKEKWDNTDAGLFQILSGLLIEATGRDVDDLKPYLDIDQTFLTKDYVDYKAGEDHSLSRTITDISAELGHAETFRGEDFNWSDFLANPSEYFSRKGFEPGEPTEGDMPKSVAGSKMLDQMIEDIITGARSASEEGRGDSDLYEEGSGHPEFWAHEGGHDDPWTIGYVESMLTTYRGLYRHNYVDEKGYWDLINNVPWSELEKKQAPRSMFKDLIGIPEE
jgi:hypothetical protein